MFCPLGPQKGTEMVKSIGLGYVLRVVFVCLCCLTLFVGVWWGVAATQAVFIPTPSEWMFGPVSWAPSECPSCKGNQIQILTLYKEFRCLECGLDFP